MGAWLDKWPFWEDCLDRHPAFFSSSRRALLAIDSRVAHCTAEILLKPEASANRAVGLKLREEHRTGGGTAVDSVGVGVGMGTRVERGRGVEVADGVIEVVIRVVEGIVETPGIGLGVVL